MPIGLRHNLKFDAAMPAALAQLMQPLNQFAAIVSIRPDLFQPPLFVLQWLQDRSGPIPILNIRGMHPNFEEEAEGIDQNMPFSTRYFLASIIAPRPPFSVVLTV